MILKAEDLPVWHREDLDLRDYDPAKVMDFIVNPKNEDYWLVYDGQEGLDRLFQYNLYYKLNYLDQLKRGLDIIAQSGEHQGSTRLQGDC